MKAFPAISAPGELHRLKGRRVPASGASREDALANARRKAWWPAVLSKKPIFSMGRWWFVIPFEWKAEG